MKPGLITPLLLTLDEEANLGRCLAGLGWAERIVVIDSGSRDGTLDLCRAHGRVEVFHRDFDRFAAQANFGLEKITTPWVLSLDADYVVPDGFLAELEGLDPAPGMGGYAAGFRYCVYGRPLRASLYPPRTVLFRREGSTYRDDGHAHRVRVEGTVGRLRAVLAHDDRKPLRRWFASQARYATEEADKLLGTPAADLSSADRLRATGWAAPPAVLLWTLFGRGLILDGWRGWFYVLQRVCAECMLAATLVGRRLEKQP